MVGPLTKHEKEELEHFRNYYAWRTRNNILSKLRRGTHPQSKSWKLLCQDVDRKKSLLEDFVRGLVQEDLDRQVANGK